MDGSVLEEKSSLKSWGCIFSNWVGVFTLFLLLKLPPKKIRALICSMTFLSPEVALCLLYLQCGLACNIAVMSALVLIASTWNCQINCQKIFKTVDPSLIASVEPLAHCQNVVSLSLFYKYYFGRCSSKLAQLVPLFYSRGRSTRYSDKFHGFSVIIPRCYKDVYVNSFFPCTARLWNSLPVECFLLT